MFLLTYWVILALAIGCVALTDGEWDQFKSRFGKHYSNPIEDARRKELFKATDVMIRGLNSEDRHSFTVGHNKYSDWTQAERDRLRGMKNKRKYHLDPIASGKMSHILANLKSNVPDRVDWSKVPGVVTEVKDQGYCGSCWAFSTTGVLEGQQKNLNLTLTSLSEQNLIDCSAVNDGCDGGDSMDALEFISEQGGIQDSKSYPYEEQEGSCRYNKRRSVMKISGCSMLTPAGDEENLKRVVAAFGPIAIGISADNRHFEFYDSGIFNYRRCKKELDHAMLLVGYGTNSKGEEYWLVKNSYGKDWGEKGYIRMARNKDNLCGIASEPIIPLF